MPSLCRQQPRRLHFKAHRLIDNYERLFRKFADSLQLFERVQTLHQKAGKIPKLEAIAEYETLDTIRCEAAEFAESKCQKVRRGQVAFLPALNKRRLKIRAWLLLLNKVKGKKVSSRLIARALQNANLPSETRGLYEEDVKGRLNEEYNTYYDIKGEAQHLRSTALEALAEALAEQGNKDKEKMLKALREREQQRHTAKKIRYLRGKVKSFSTSMVTTLDSEGNRVDITDQREMERAILEKNQKKFTQSAHTPFYLHPLKDEFSFKSLTLAAQTTLAGLYKSNQDIDSRILDVVAQWQMSQAVKDLDPLKMELFLATCRHTGGRQKRRHLATLLHCFSLP